MKKYKKYWFLCCFVFLIFSTKATAQTFALQKSIAINCEQVVLDKLDNIYLVSAQKIEKYNTQAQLLFSYENTLNDAIDYFDASNAMKPLVYYRNSGVVLILDQKLSPINRVDLWDKNSFNLEAICSYNNIALFAYDLAENKIYQFNKNIEIVAESDILSQHITPFKQLKSLQNIDNKLYLHNENGLYVFDLYFNLLHKIEQKNIPFFQILGNTISYFQDNKVKLYNFISFSEKTWSLPQNIAIQNLKALIFKNETLVVVESEKTYWYKQQ